MREQQTSTGREVYIVDGARTPLLKARGEPGPFSAADLAVYAGRDLIERMPFAATALDEVITGCVMPSADEANISRLIALRLGCGDKTPAWTVQRNCASGLQALDSGVASIASGRHELIMAGGTEAMSQAPLLLNQSMVQWLSAWYAAKSLKNKLQALLKLRPAYFIPVIALLRGLNDPLVGLSMGQTAENLAYKFNITRQQMDQFAVQSHQRLAQAQQKNLLTELVTLYSTQGQFYSQDDGVRADSTLEKLAALKPFFDKKFGKVTAGNSSQVTDGAAFLILASAEAVKKYKLPILARIIDTHWAGVAPEEMGLGPVHAVASLLKAHNKQLSEIDYWEINEAFAAQVLACLAAWESEDYCREQLGLNQALGTINQEQLNIDGGGIAVGHPVGTSGARIVLRLAHILKRKNAKTGIATLCIGGGQGGAMLIENVSEVMG